MRGSNSKPNESFSRPRYEIMIWVDHGVEVGASNSRYKCSEASVVQAEITRDC